MVDAESVDVFIMVSVIEAVDEPITTTFVGRQTVGCVAGAHRNEMLYMMDVQWKYSKID